MKRTILSLIIIMTLLFVPIRVNAMEMNINNYFIQYGVDENDPSKWNEGYNQEQTCEGDNSMLGSVNDPDSVAWLLQQVLNYIKILGPILVVVLSSVEFAKVIINSDDEAMAKAQRKLITRIILAACLFFIPTLVEAALDLFGFTSNATCGIQ